MIRKNHTGFSKGSCPIAMLNRKDGARSCNLSRLFSTGGYIGPLELRPWFILNRLCSIVVCRIESVVRNYLNVSSAKTDTRVGAACCCIPARGLDRARAQAAHASNGFCTRIVSSRSGLVESKAIGHPTSSSTRRTYLIACAGRSAHERALAVGSFQPSMVS